MGLSCFEGPMETTAFERATHRKTAFTAVHDGHRGGCHDGLGSGALDGGFGAVEGGPREDQGESACVADPGHHDFIG